MTRTINVFFQFSINVVITATVQSSLTETFLRQILVGFKNAIATLATFEASFFGEVHIKNNQCNGNNYYCKEKPHRSQGN